MKFLVVCLRLMHKIISETPKLKHDYIFAVENPTHTLKHMISVSFSSCTEYSVQSCVYFKTMDIFLQHTCIILYSKYMLLIMIYEYIAYYVQSSKISTT